MKIKILISPLNWGLGHASRIIPIIKELENQNFEVIIAIDKSLISFYKKELPSNKLVILNSYYKIKYSNNNKLWLQILLQIPKLFYAIYKEHFELKKIIKIFNPNIIISDNRFGLYNKNVYTIFISHQINIIAPKAIKFLEKTILNLNKFFISKFNECWIPDFELENSIAGKLSHPSFHKKTNYIGLLSRLSLFNKPINNSIEKYDIFCLISGPEPQRSIFEHKCIEILKNTKYKVFIARGISESKNQKIQNNIIIKDFISTNELMLKIEHSKLIICRSGYSSIMDLAFAKKKALLVPTPGQTEQEYLAEYLKNKFNFEYVCQKDFSLNHIQKSFENSIWDIKYMNFNILSDIIYNLRKLKS